MCSEFIVQKTLMKPSLTLHYGVKRETEKKNSISSKFLKSTAQLLKTSLLYMVKYWVLYPAAAYDNHSI